MSAAMPHPTAPDPKRPAGKPRRESIEKPPPQPERGRRRGPEDIEPSRTPRDGDFDPNVNSTRT